MEVIPAIDLRGGKCVRFYQGDYERETVYSEDPLGVATRWVSEGAPRLHVVDLDGARDGALANADLVKAIASSTQVPVQLGGGIRTIEAARNAVALGVTRVIIGTAAVERPDLVRELCLELGAEAVVVGVDARDGYVSVRGWTHSSRLTAADLIGRIETMGVRRFVYTDVARDGTLTEPNFAAIGELRARTELRMIVAGGIASSAHLQRLSRLGVEGAIVGTALYTGDIHLREAIERVSKAETSGTSRS